MKTRIIFALALLGITSMSAQIVLMRELLIVFYGNELSLGITLACWLFWIGFGSWGMGRWIIRKINGNLILFAFLEIILAFLLPLSVLCVRFIPLIFGFSPGEIIDILPMSLAAFILLAPVCILGGFLFVLGCELYPGVDSSAAVKIGYVYIFEAIGAAFGGLLTSMVLIRFFTPVHIMCLFGLLNLASAVLLSLPRKVLSLFAAIVLTGFIFFTCSGRLDYLNGYSLKKQWSCGELLASKNSVYGNIAVTKKENLYTIFTNGLYDFSVPDKLTSEGNAHFPLLEHPGPADVLLIGGGSSNVLEEVLKHPVRTVDYVELDPLIIDLTQNYLPPKKAISDPRVKTITNMDARLFIKKTAEKYDAVIINLPEPHTAQINRFYTKEFYRELKYILKPGGIVSFSLHSNPNYISQEQAELYRTLKRTLMDVFEEVEITPGNTNYFLASNQKGILTLDWRILTDRLKERNIAASYIREYYLYSELSEDRIDFFKKALETPQQCMGVEVNKDFHPIAYYYDMVLWSTYFKYNLKKLFKAVDPGKIYKGAFFCYLLLLIPIWIRVIKKKIPGWAILTCVGTTGFAEISFQIVTLLSFQVLYGYVYYKLGIVLSSYMMGLILGGWVITRRLQILRGRNHNLFIKTQAAIFIYPLILLPLLWIFSTMKGNLPFWLGSNIIFPFLPVIPGFIGGFQFPLANSLYLSFDGVRPGSSAGLTYGLDLFGACAGAILTAVFLIPVIGLAMTCILTAGLNLTGLILLLTY